MNKMPWAVILGGGGARGAYQVGVLKAIKELKIKIGGIYGTSVGALNGALFISTNFQKIIDLWQNINISDIIEDVNDIENLVKLRFDNISNFLKNIIINNGLNTSPLHNLIKTHLNEDKIRLSNIDFGFCCFNISDFKAYYFTKDQIPKGKLIDYLYATSSLPGFSPVEINDGKYIDGGVFDNLPVKLAIDRGFKKIIAVDLLAPGVIQKFNYENLELIYLKPSKKLPEILQFERNMITNSMMAGYYDMLKIAGSIEGFKYYIQPDIRSITKISKLLKDYELWKKTNLFSFYPNLENIIEKKIKPLNEKLIYYILDITAEYLNIDDSKLWNVKDLIYEIYAKYNYIKNINIDTHLYDEFINKNKEYNKLLKKLIDVDSSSLLSHLRLNELNKYFLEYKVFKLFLTFLENYAEDIISF